MYAPLIVLSRKKWAEVDVSVLDFFSALAEQQPVIFIEANSAQTVMADVARCRSEIAVLHCSLFSADEKSWSRTVAVIRSWVGKYFGSLTECVLWADWQLPRQLHALLAPKSTIVFCNQAFEQASAQWQGRKSDALQLADLVVARDAELACALRSCHPQVLALAAQFEPHIWRTAVDRSTSHELHRDISGPRLGYFGPLDRYFDADALRRLADAHERWQIVVVADSEDAGGIALPKRPNIHYMGHHSIDALPRFFAGWELYLQLRVGGPVRSFDLQHCALACFASALPLVSLQSSGSQTDPLVTYCERADLVRTCEQVLLRSEEEQIQWRRDAQAAASSVQLHAPLLSAVQKLTTLPGHAGVGVAEARLRFEEVDANVLGTDSVTVTAA